MYLYLSSIARYQFAVNFMPDFRAWSFDKGKVNISNGSAQSYSHNFFLLSRSNTLVVVVGWIFNSIFLLRAA